MFFVKHVLHKPRFDTYTVIFTGFSGILGCRLVGHSFIAWVRVRKDEALPDREVIVAMRSEENG